MSQYEKILETFLKGVRQYNETCKMVHGLLRILSLTEMFSVPPNID
jgi:hypothetical protein